jgi:hypothetical protein
MTGVNYPPAVPFAVPSDHPNRAAHQWLNALLDQLDWRGPTPSWHNQHVRDLILGRLNEQAPAFQIALLKACLEQMPWHRRHAPSEATPAHYSIGSLLYEIACTLYGRKLGYSEADICEILRLSQHRCGHGSDVTPPFEIALDYARDNDLTSELLAALKTFLSNLKSVGSSQASHLKRKAGLLLVLDERPGRRTKRCWSDRFRAGLLHLPAEEQSRWRGLVLHMKINDLPVMPEAWRPQAATFLADLGPELVLARLSSWWPDPDVSKIWPLQTGGSHLLKHFIWLLALMPQGRDLWRTDDQLLPKCTALVCRLSFLDWNPRQQGQKVVIAAAHYLAQFPPAVSWLALERLGTWSSTAPGEKSGGKIPELLRKYRAQHEAVISRLVEARHE